MVVKNITKSNAKKVTKKILKTTAIAKVAKKAVRAVKKTITKKK